MLPSILPYPSCCHIWHISSICSAYSTQNATIDSRMQTYVLFQVAPGCICSAYALAMPNLPRGRTSLVELTWGEKYCKLFARDLLWYDQSGVICPFWASGDTDRLQSLPCKSASYTPHAIWSVFARSHLYSLSLPKPRHRCLLPTNILWHRSINCA